MMQCGRQNLADCCMTGWHRHIRGVINLPDLEFASQFFIGQKLISDVDPGLGAARQSMQHHDDAPPRVEGLHQIQMRLIDSTLTSKQPSQRLLVESRTCQLQAVASRKVTSQWHALTMEL